MLKQIHVSDLRPGMQTINPGIDWKSRPFLYSEEVKLESEEQIKRIVDDGYLEVIIDLDRSDSGAFTSALPDGGKPVSLDGVIIDGGRLFTVRPLLPKVSLYEEMPQAAKVHDEGLAYARRFMADIQSGKVNLSSASTVMEHIMESVERNADALLSLSRLHRTDTYTYTHCVNVCVLSTVFARYLGEEKDKIYAAGVAGLFHDLGKALVPQKILNAPRRLSPEEFAIMRRHPMLGYEQLASVPGMLPDVLRGALEHHEKHDGTGYPKKLSGEAISIIGRIVGISDVYDALTSQRSYKGAMFPHKALGIMYQGRDRDFHADFLAHFIRMLGVYPVGSVVELEDGCKGVVAASNFQNPAKPVVTLTIDACGRPMRDAHRDLSEAGSPVIVRCIPAEGSGISPLRTLGIVAG